MKTINHIDGWLYVGMAVCTAVTAALSSADAQKFYNPWDLWLVKTYAEVLGAAFLAGKTYRSTTYAKAQDQSTPPPNEK
jgi:hypothetical protein